jgi:hypothetical protein
LHFDQVSKEDCLFKAAPGFVMSMLALTNPQTGGIDFGRIPQLRLVGITYPESRIQLFVGRHIGPNKGFGARHIWAEHRNEMAQVGLNDEADVAAYVLRIVRTGTPLVFEGGSWTVTRLLAVRAASGTAILEYRDRREGPIWSVVTAYSGTKTHGTRVGTVR